MQVSKKISGLNEQSPSGGNYDKKTPKKGGKAGRTTDGHKHKFATLGINRKGVRKSTFGPSVAQTCFRPQEVRHRSRFGIYQC